MDRRTFIGSLTGTVIAGSFAAQAATEAVPVVGFLRSTPAKPFAGIVAAFRQGLADAGYVDGQDVRIEYRWADNQLDRLPALASDLVRLPVDVIVGNSLAVEAARAATTTIPIVFVTSDDPVARGLVARLSRPGGNLTGITFFGGGQLGAKRLQLLHELVPAATVTGFLMDPNWPGSEAELPEVQAAAGAIGVTIVPARAASERELESAFAALARAGAGALVVSGCPLYTTLSQKIVTLAARRSLPAIYDLREHVARGGLISYAASFSGAYRQAGIYAGRILQGAKAAELPVLQPTTFDLAVNLKTARALSLTVPPSLLLRADEVIE